MKHLDRFFRLSQREATLAGEIRGGCTTFCSMVYLILVIPGLLSGVGMDFGQAMTAACLIAADENLVDMGSLATPEPLLALLGIFLTAVLVMKKVPGALMLGMALTVVLGIPLGVTVLPQPLTAPPGTVSGHAETGLHRPFGAGADPAGLRTALPAGVPVF